MASSSDMNLSDFDNSDDDLADLLADDEDDDAVLKSKKSTTKENKLPIKANQEPAKPLSKGENKQGSVQKRSEEIPSPKHSPLTSPNRKSSKLSFDAVEDDTENSSEVPSFLKDLKSSPVKTKLLRDSPQQSKFLDDLDVTSLKDNSRSLLKKQVSKKEDNDSESESILKTLDSDTENKAKAPFKRKDSFFDGFLKNLSPKKTALVDNLSENHEDDDKSENLEKENSIKIPSIISKPRRGKDPILQKKRDTFTKQVSFKDISDILPDSPLKEKPHSSTGHAEVPGSPKKIPSKSAPPARRSEKIGVSKTDDTDWLSFFKESPKKNNPSVQSVAPKDEAISKKTPDSTAATNWNARRRSSNAEWLGLDESEIQSKYELATHESQKSLQEQNDDLLASGEPNILINSNLTKGQTRPSRRNAAKTFDASWLGDAQESHTLPSKSQTSASKEEKIDALNNKFTRKEVPNSKQVTDSMFGKREPTRDKQSIAPADSSTSLPPAEKLSDIRADSSVLNPEAVPSANLSRGLEKTFKALQVSQNQIGENTHDLQILIDNFSLEKAQLIQSSEAMKSMYEDRINSIQGLHKDQLKSTEESFKLLEKNLRSEIEVGTRASEEKVINLQTEKIKQEAYFKEKMEELEKHHQMEIQRLKDLQNRTVSTLKQDHEEALSRLKRLKEQEIETIISTQAHSRSLQQITDQLESRASELFSFQSQLEQKKEMALKERESFLVAKEKDLKALGSRYQKQLDEGDEERTRLQQLVLKLESRLQKCTTEGEEDRWEVQQMKARLTVQQKHLEEEHKLQVLYIEKEKEKIGISQSAMLHEQKTVLLQLAQERQQLSQEKIDIELLAKRVKEEESRFNFKKLKEESYIEKQKQFLLQEEHRLNFEKNNVQQEHSLLEREKDALSSEKQTLKVEKMSFNDQCYKAKKMTSEAEEMAMKAADDKENARIEYSLAQKIKADHQNRLRQIGQQVQQLMEKEHQILAEKEKLVADKLELENKKNSIICNRCKLALECPVIFSPLNNVGNSQQSMPGTVVPTINGFQNAAPSHVDPSLVFWYITAQRDREYLQEELSYLKSLKESSNKQNKL